MNTLDVYLEIRHDQQCIAHILALPGCFVVGQNQADAMSKLPAAVQTYSAWLHQHEDSPDVPNQPVQFNIAERIENAGARHPDDFTALFSPEKLPISTEEIESLLRLAGYRRADLLEAVRGLSTTIRRWRPAPGAHAIDRILRHIAYGERWYITRLWQESEVPADWYEQDSAIPTMRFLAQIRQQALTQLRQLSAEKRSQQFTPNFRTANPTEQWTARKVLRRLLEHEREHLAHIHENLLRWRQQFRARLAAERAYFFSQFRSLSAEVLANNPVDGDWTAGDMLPHMGMWDAFHTERLDWVKNGRIADIEIINETILNERNAQSLRQFKQMPLEQAFAVALKERSGFLAMLHRLSDYELHRVRRLANGERTTVAAWANRRWQHDAAHADQLATWRTTLPRDWLFGTGPKYILQAILHTARKSFLTLLPLLPPGERESMPVCGVWTMKDLLGHLTDWEKVGVDGLRQLAAGQTPEFSESIRDFDTFNNRNAAARHGQSWPEVWQDFTNTRQTLLDLLAAVPDEALKRPFVTPWGSRAHGYYFTTIWAGHEMEHAIDVRHALQLPGLPRRLRSHK